MAYRWRALLAILCIAVLSWAARHFDPDDALIVARYVRNALQGHGLVFNVGQRVNAATSPLHISVLLIASWVLRGKVMLAQWLVGISFLTAAALLSEWFVPYSGILIGSLVYFETFLDMETPLFVFLLLLSVVLYVTGRWRWLPLVLCLTALTRFEGGAIILPIAWQMRRRHAWPKLWTFLPPLLLLAIFSIASFHFYGKWIPSSGTAKIQQGESGLWGRWPTAFLRVPHALWYPVRSLWYVIPLGFWLAWRGARTAAFTTWNVIVPPFLAILLSFYVLLNIPGYVWYFAPFVLFALIYAAQGLPHSRWSAVGVLLVAIHGAVLGSYVLSSFPDIYADYRTIATWLNANAAPDATVASDETGTVGWYAPVHPVIDIVGLTEPRNAQHLARRDGNSWLAEDKPDYVIVHNPPGFGELVALHSPDYEPVGETKSYAYLLRRIPGH